MDFPVWKDDRPFGPDEAFQYIRNEIAYQMALEVGRIGIWERELATDTVRFSPMLLQILGLPPDQPILSVEQWHALLLPEGLALFEQIGAAAAESGLPFEMEFRARRPDGSLIWLLDRGIILKDQDGKPAWATGICLDITEKKQAEEERRASEQRFQMLADHSPEGIIVETEGIWVYANDAAARMVGAAHARDLVGRSPFDVLPACVHDILRKITSIVLEEKQYAPLIDMNWPRPDGTPVYVQTSAGGITWSGQPAIQIVMRDITEARQAQQKLHLTSERLKLVIEESGEAIWDWDIVTDEFSISGGLSTVFRWPEDGTGRHADWCQAIHPEDLQYVNETMQECLNGTAPVFRCEFRMLTKDHQWIWIQSRGIVVARDASGAPTVMTGTMTDISARKESDETVWRHANLDVLTGLPNRRLFREQLSVEVRKANRSGHQLALLFIDLDRFKQVNDLLGHDAGDLLLIDAAKRLRHCLRETDMVARIGGDEFTVLLTELDRNHNTEVVCQKILFSLSEPYHVGHDIAHVSGSVGVAIYPADAHSGDELLRKADQAMYSSKSNGKNQFTYYTRHMDEQAHLRLRLVNDLHNALQAGQLSVHFQPIVTLNNGKITKAEALVRWTHPELGNVPPDKFIPLAEEIGLIVEIDDWVFRQAASYAKRWGDLTGQPFQISVNKSPLQFTTRHTRFDWFGYLVELGLPINSICIEITEGLLLDGSANVLDRLAEFRKAGISFAIDDFGTGYSSMNYVKKFNVDFLKIDQSFVRNLETDHQNRAITEVIILMGKKLRLNVIAEGVETDAQMRFLKECGCDYAQGYLFSRPVPAHDFETLLIGNAQENRHN